MFMVAGVYFSRAHVVPSILCVCVDSLTGGESLCHDGVSTHRPVLSPHLEAALTKIKFLVT
jgi:hypothetical protein